MPSGLEDVSKYVELVSALYATGKWTIEDLKKLVGLNFLRVYREVEQVQFFLYLKKSPFVWWCISDSFCLVTWSCIYCNSYCIWTFCKINYTKPKLPFLMTSFKNRKSSQKTFYKVYLDTFFLSKAQKN